MRRDERLDAIIASLADTGSVSVAELTDRLGPRRPHPRDLELLEEQHLLTARTAARSATGPSTSCRSAIGAARRWRRSGGSPSGGRADR